MQTIVYHSKARKTMCGMGTFCLIGMISFQLTMQNGEMKTYIKTVQFSNTLTVPSGNSGMATIPINTPDGYKPVLAVITDTRQAKVLPRACWISSNSAVTIYVDNLSGTSYSDAIFINVLFIRQP